MSFLKLWALGQNTVFHMSGQHEVRQHPDFPGSGHSFLFILRKFEGFFFPLLIFFFSLLSSCIIRRAHMKFAVKSNYQMLLTNETFHTYSSLTSGSHQGQGTQVCHHTREGQNVEGNLLYTRITKSLVNASPND